MNKPFKAIVRAGVYARKEVMLTGQKSVDGKSFESRIVETGKSEKFLPEELFPIGDWHFNASDEIVDYARVRPTFPNGDPFELIPKNHIHPDKPILIQLRCGLITVAYPCLNYIAHNEVIYSLEFHDLNFLVCDNYAESEHIIHVRSMNIVNEKDVVAWKHFPDHL